MADENNERIDPAEIASLMNSAIGALSPNGEFPRDGTKDSLCGPEKPRMPPLAPLDFEAAHSDHLAEARPYELPSFDGDEYHSPDSKLANVDIAEVELHIELGRALLPIEEEGALREGAVVSLDKLAGDPVDILIDGRLIARGEVLVLKDKFCVRVAEIIGSSFAMETRSQSAVA